MEKTERQAASAPLKARIMLAHAYFQRVANANGIDILHVKGYAFGPEVYRPERHSTTWICWYAPPMWTGSCRRL